MPSTATISLLNSLTSDPKVLAYWVVKVVWLTICSKCLCKTNFVSNKTIARIDEKNNTIITMITFIERMDPYGNKWDTLDITINKIDCFGNINNFHELNNMYTGYYEDKLNTLINYIGLSF